MTGKQKCRILKEIRQQIARQNDINLVVKECTHQGECRGTCPRCEAEVQYLERELDRRRQHGRRVALAGISAGVTLSLTGCAAVAPLMDAVERTITRGNEPYIEQLTGEVDEPLALDGEVYINETGEISGPDALTEPNDEPEDIPDCICRMRGNDPRRRATINGMEQAQAGH